MRDQNKIPNFQGYKCKKKRSSISSHSHFSLSLSGEKMKDSGEPPSSVKKEASSDAISLFGKGRYKFWALAAILLLAFWSMLTGSVSLKWSSTSLNPFPGDLLDSSSSAVSIDVLVPISLNLYDGILIVNLLISLACSLFRKWRRGRRRCGECGISTRTGSDRGCRGSGGRRLRRRMRISPEMILSSGMPLLLRSRGCHCVCLTLSLLPLPAR